ncbi:MAG TPA: discoidin domain-containing protein [Crocinitomicaceae bacterium]|nr:discoidin domain-containing protein [Crocinitomicaceae bacterium]
MKIKNKKTTILCAFFVLLSTTILGQSASDVFLKDANGNLVNPNMSMGRQNGHHTLLGFTAYGETFSTGVDDALLTSHGISFQPLEFKSLNPGNSITLNSSSYYGTPTDQGATFPNNLKGTTLLYDGTSGLDISTGIFNATGSIVYGMDSINEQQVSDNIPDIVLTQIGDPSGSTNDRIYFTDAFGVQVGLDRTVNFASATELYQQHYYLYKTNDGTKGFDNNQSRSVRIMAFKLSDFGINETNYQSITRFVHVLSGTSDQAFVAFNGSSFSALPVELSRFAVTEISTYENQISIETATEQNNEGFTIEYSNDGVQWNTLSTIKGAGNSSVATKYELVFNKTQIFKGINYFRLKQTDFNGKTKTYNPISFDNKIDFIVTAENTLRLNQEEYVLVYDNLGRVLQNELTNEIDLSSINGMVFVVIGNYTFKYIK